MQTRVVKDLKLRNLDAVADRFRVERLISEIEERDLHPALGERKLFDLVDPPSESQSLSNLVAENDAEVFAYLALRPESEGVLTVETAVHPEHRTEAVLDTLLTEATEMGAAGGAGAVRVWAYVPEVMQACERAGFAQERELFHLRAPLPVAETPRFASAIAVRGFREGIDESAWLQANNQVFSGHPENGNWELEDLNRRRRRSWFSSRALRLAWDGDILAGFCWTKTPSSRAGEIYAIGVTPDYQGGGLGRALLLEGMNYMHNHDRAQACVLYVDAANLPALKMYRSMGFGHHHTDRSYLLRLGGEARTVGAGTLAG